jgi:hypothetical protein
MGSEKWEVRNGKWEMRSEKWEEIKKWEFRPKNLPSIITKLSANICVKSFSELFPADWIFFLRWSAWTFKRNGKWKVKSEKWRLGIGEWRMGNRGEKFFARTLSLRALAAIICHEDEKKRSWFCNGQNYRNSPCIVFDYFHKEFIGKSINHRIGKLYNTLCIICWFLGLCPKPHLLFCLDIKK